MRLSRRQPIEPLPRWTPGQPTKPVHIGADITELFPPPGPVPDYVKGADITQLFPEPPPPPPELLFPQQPPSPSEGVSTPAGDIRPPETAEKPPTEALEVLEVLEVQDKTPTPAENPETSSTRGGDTPETETIEKPRREMIADHVEVPIEVPVEENHPRERVYGQRGQELPPAARPKSGKLPRTGPPPRSVPAIRRAGGNQEILAAGAPPVECLRCGRVRGLVRKNPDAFFHQAPKARKDSATAQREHMLAEAVERLELLRDGLDAAVSGWGTNFAGTARYERFMEASENLEMALDYLASVDFSYLVTVRAFIPRGALLAL